MSSFKELTGQSVQFIVQGVKPFTAKVMSDHKDFIIVKGEGESKARRLIKNKIVLYTPEEEGDTEASDLYLLYCENPSINCPGVQYIKSGKGYRQVDFDTFMNPCPLRQSSCRQGSHGDIRCISTKKLSEVLHGTLFGDYPESNDQ